MLRLTIAAALAVALASPVAARPRHVHHRHHRAHIASTGRPAACAGIAWCGCWLRLHLGLSDVRLNRARAWTGVGTDAGGPGAGVIAVWAHHVGIIVRDLGHGTILLLSGNDGNAVRERPRSVRGIIAFRRLQS